MRLLSCALAAALLWPAAAQAQSETARRWGITFHQAGVQMEVDRDCRGSIAGHYTPSSRTITVCLNNINSIRELYAVMAHEAIHAAQHCVGIANGRPGELMPLSIVLAKSDPALAVQWMAVMRRGGEAKSYGMSGSRRHNRSLTTPLLEEEAYTLEDHPEDALSFFRSACTGG